MCPCGYRGFESRPLRLRIADCRLQFGDAVDVMGVSCGMRTRADRRAATGRLAGSTPSEAQAPRSEPACQSFGEGRSRPLRLRIADCGLQFGDAVDVMGVSCGMRTRAGRRAATGRLAGSTPSEAQAPRSEPACQSLGEGRSRPLRLRISDCGLGIGNVASMFWTKPTTSQPWAFSAPAKRLDRSDRVVLPRFLHYVSARPFVPLDHGP